jgi:hypothetical protein
MMTFSQRAAFCVFPAFDEIRKILKKNQKKEYQNRHGYFFFQIKEEEHI